MLPWNPPSSFSSGNDVNSGQQQPQYRPNYEQHPQQPQPPPQQQQQQQQQPQQQQAGVVPGQPPAYPPMTLSSTLHFLQSEHRRYARDRNEWEIERAEMRARIALLEGEKRGNEGALRDLGRRCKMLENALRGERSKFLSTTNALAQHSPSPSGTSSPVQIPPTAASGIPPAKAAQLLSNLNPSKESKESKESGTATLAPESAPMAPSTSSPGVAAPAPAVTVQPPGHQTRASSSLGMNGGTLNGTWGTGAGTLGGAGGTLGAGRDPRGKARSRDYLKQCLQEITYLTSATTMNPLSATSYSAPNVPRPRKVLPDHVPAPGVPGVFNVAFPPRAGSGDSSTAAGAPPAAAAPAPPLPISSAAFELPPLQQQQLASQAHPITKFPSDAASAFVPLKRTISQPGLPGGPPVSSVRDLPSTTAASDPFTPVIESNAGQTSQSNTAAAVEDKAGEKEPVNESASLEVGDSFSNSEHDVGIDTISLDEQSTTSTLSAASTTTINAGISGLDETGNSSSLFIAGGDGREPELNGHGDTSGIQGSSSDDWPTLSRVGRRGGNNERAATLGRRSLDNGDVNAALGGDQLDIVGLEGAVGRKGGESDGARSRLTALFAPEGDEAWKEELRKAGEQQYTPEGGARLASKEEQELDTLNWDDEEEEPRSRMEAGAPLWKSRGVLRSHLDAARALAFVDEDISGLSLLSGGDDNVVKLWRGIKTSRSSTDLEPIITYRGHEAPVTSIVVSSSNGLVYSASLDGSIRIWRLPALDHETYAPFDASSRVGVLEGSGDAAWGLALFHDGEEERLASITADGLLNVWDASKREKLRSWGYEGVTEGSRGRKVIPTALALVDSVAGKPQQLAVAYFNAVVKLFDPVTGEATMQLQADEAFDGTSRTQINQIASHPTKPLLATAHEDRVIQLWDLDTGSFLHSIAAHQEAVTSLTFLPASCSLASVSTDSLRFFDSDLTCVQDIALARSKMEEGVLAVLAHEKEPVLVTAGADGCIRLFVKE